MNKSADPRGIGAYCTLTTTYAKQTDPELGRLLLRAEVRANCCIGAGILALPRRAVKGKAFGQHPGQVVEQEYIDASGDGLEPTEGLRSCCYAD